MYITLICYYLQYNTALMYFQFCHHHQTKQNNRFCSIHACNM